MTTIFRQSLRKLAGLIGSRIRDFRGADAGNFLIIFSFALIPMVLATGGAVDFSALMTKRSEMQNAADMAVIAAASQANATFSAREKIADRLFLQNMSQTSPTPTGTLRESKGVFTYEATTRVENHFLSLVRIPSFDVAVSASASATGPDLDIAFVLDNSGSMGGDRIRELKSSVTLFLDEFKDKKGRAQVAIVPFHSGVRVSDLDLAKADTNLDFIDCRLLENGTNWDNFFGPLCRSSKPGFVMNTKGAYVAQDGTDQAFLYKADSSNGRNRILADKAVCKDSGYRARGDRCFDYKVIQVTNFLVYDQPSKQTCVVDRDQPYDTTDDAPDRDGRRYPTSQCDTNEIGLVHRLDTNLDLVANHVQSLTAEGSTNLTIGMQWGMEALSATLPLTGRRADAKPIIVLLSDGKNQKNRWDFLYGNTTPIDNRTLAACQWAKTRKPPIEIYAVNLIDGDPSVLKKCASSDSQYYAVGTAKELKSVFSSIASRIKGVRLVN